MIGEIVFGQPPMGAIPRRPHVERGWVKQCKKGGDWLKQVKNEVSTQECGYSAVSHYRGEK